MLAQTPYYGKILSIVDNRTSYIHKDSNGNEYTFEVYPINITENDINNALTGISNAVWFIAYKTTILPPTTDDIDKALTTGQLIKLSMMCNIIDNYGLAHSLSFNIPQETYSIKLNLSIHSIIKNKTVLQLSDTLIKIIKEVDNPTQAVQGLTNSSRLLIGIMMDRLDALETRLKSLE
jgi:hypothetical protein